MEAIEDERIFIENITFTDFEDLKSIDFEKTISFVRNCLASQQTNSQINNIRSQRSNGFSQGFPILSNSICGSQIIPTSESQLVQNDGNISRNVVSTQQTDLSNWGLPPEIVAKYMSKGVKHMFKWQVECLRNAKVINDNGNLVYSAPTSAGKTLVAEILTIKTVLERQKKVIIILPFVSVVREKMFYFQGIFSESGIRVEGYMGSHSPPGGFQAVHIAVCTIEKANSLINSMLENGSISDLGAVVVDELHLLGDPHRGYILELLLTKLLYVSRRYEEVNIQIVGMSATLPNLSLLSQWLDAELYKTDFRPIPLNEQYHVGGCIYNSKKELARTLQKSEDLPGDKDNVILLSLETIAQGCSVLIFCPSKNWCENLAQQISSSFRSIGYSGSSYSTQLREQLNGSALSEVLEQLKSCPVGLDAVLHQTISFGVAFHHAGLTMDERDIIEGAFKRNVIRVLVSTSTLSSGVNLPARRVIIRSPTFCSKPINILTYKQMIGRAGRMGMDTAGESILMCTMNEKNIGENLISGTLDPVSSCLEGGDKLMRAVLEAIASQVAKTPADVRLFINCTLLLNSLSNEDSMETFADETIKELIDYELVRLQTTDDETYYVATALGKACLSSSVSPQDGLILFKELQKARECFVLETDLHMIYLVTPYSICSQWGDINWMHLLKLWDRLCKAMRRVGEMVGIQESLIYRCVRGSVKTDSQAFQSKLKVLKRFYTSLALQDLINEVPLAVVASNYNCSRGLLQSLQQSAATFAGMVTAFSRQLGWKSFETLVSQFQDRLQFGIQCDLLDLMRLQSLNGVRARAIFNAGVETINQLAVADPCLIENALHAALPFQSEKERDGEMKYDVQQRNSMKNIWITGMKGVTAKEAADLLIQEARTYLQYELGVTDLKWQTRSNSNVAGNATSLSQSSVSISVENTSIDGNNLTSSVEIDSSARDNVANDQLAMNTTNDNDALINDNQSTSISLVNSPVILSESDRNYYIYDMTTQLPVNIETSTESSSLNKEVGSKDDKVNVMDTFEGFNETLDSSKSEEIKLELSPTGFVTTNDEAFLDRKSLNGADSPIDKNVLDSSNTSCKSNCSMFQSDTSKELSMFEDSLEIDTQLCKLLDKGKVRNSSESKRNSITKVEVVAQTNEITKTEVVANTNEITKTEDAVVASEMTKREAIAVVSEITTTKDSVVANDVTKTEVAVINSEISTANFTSIDKIFAAPFEESLKAQDEPRKSLDDVIMSSQEDSTLNCTRTTKVVTPKRKIDNNTAGIADKVKRRRFLNSENIFGNSSNCNKNGDFIAPSPIKQSNILKSRNVRTTQKVSKKVESCNVPDFVINGLYKKIKVPSLMTETVPIRRASSFLYLVDATKDVDLFAQYCSHVMQVNTAALHLDFEAEKPLPKIGCNIVKSNNVSTSTTSRYGIKSYQGKCLKSVAIFIEKNIAYYFDFKDNMRTRVVDFLRSLLDCRSKTVILYECKNSFMALYRCIDVILNAKWEDPVVADWLLNPESYPKPLHKMFETYCSVDMKTILKDKGTIDAVCLNAWATYYAMQSVKNTVRKKYTGLIETFRTEMSALRVVSECEMCGMEVDKGRAGEVLNQVKDMQSVLEKQAYKLAGQRFKLSSPSDVAKVLGMYKGRRVCTNKKTLEKIDNPLAQIIIYWRKLSAVLSKNLFPLVAKAVENGKEKRIYGSYWTLTSTGRMSMQEPNLQSVPRNFEIPSELVTSDDHNKQVGSYFSCRSIFPAPPSTVLVSADYCQLELRLLAHLCGDGILRQIVTSDRDIFKAIAATWKCIAEDEVDDDLRQKAKQMCYGIIYGMGCKTLAQTLDVCELEASVFINTFHAAYPGIQEYVNRVIDSCRKQGYVETLSGRRRYLPLINGTSFSEKSHAERQAVNTTIQGSAADILKSAMISLYEKLEASPNLFRDVKLILLLHDELIYEVPLDVMYSFVEILRQCMENTVMLSVPLPVKVKTGNLWGDMKEFK